MNTQADETLRQLGGPSRLNIVMGAKEFFSEDNGQSLVFKTGAGAKNKIKHIKITLDPNDTYTVVFSAISRKKDPDLNLYIPTRKEISRHPGIYCDRLETIIERETGFLYL